MKRDITKSLYSLLILLLFSCSQTPEESVKMKTSNDGAYTIEQTEQVVDLYT